MRSTRCRRAHQECAQGAGRHGKKQRSFHLSPASSGAFLNQDASEPASIPTCKLLPFGVLDDLFYDDAVALRVHKSFSCEGLLADCSDYEKAILVNRFRVKDDFSTK